MIFFVTLKLNRGVLAIGLGFTDMLICHVFATSPESASSLATAWYSGKGCDVASAKSVIAVQQDLRRYYLPESIINLPDHMLQSEYDRRDFPAHLRTAGRCVAVPAALH